MERGPIHSEVYSLIKNQPEWVKESSAGTIWAGYLRNTGEDEHQVTLYQDAPPTAITRAEASVIREAIARYAILSDDALWDVVHELPEYQKTAKTSIPITFAELLTKLGKDAQQIAARMEEDRRYLSFEELLQRRS